MNSDNIEMFGKANLGKGEFKAKLLRIVQCDLGHALAIGNI